MLPELRGLSIDPHSSVSLLDDLRRFGFLARAHEGSTVIFPLLALIVFCSA